MRIWHGMGLGELAERMGNVATHEDAAAMREALVARFDGQDTGDLTEGQWLGLIDASQKAMASDREGGR